MYLYLYDSFLNNKKYNGLLARIETRLTDLGIGGKIFRLSPLRNIEELMNDEIRSGAKTIIVVGNDKTFSQIINLAAKLNITLGLIPIGSKNEIAKMLGIESPLRACDIIAARIIQKVDLGKANNTYFLSGLNVEKGIVTIECENKYKVRTSSESKIQIRNIKPAFAINAGPNIFNPQDGFLEILIKPFFSQFFGLFTKSSEEKKSIIPFKKLTIYGKDSVSVTTDGHRILKTPVKIEIVPKKLKLIVGKNRVF